MPRQIDMASEAFTAEDGGAGSGFELDNQDAKITVEPVLSVHLTGALEK